MREPGTTVIVPTLNGGERLAKALAALCAQEPPARGFETLVIDSGSSDGTLETVRRFPVRLHCIKQEEFGHGRTRNLGASLARGEWLVFLTQDAVPAHRQWLRFLTRHLERPDVAASFGRQLPPPSLGPVASFFQERIYPDRLVVHEPIGGGRLLIRRFFFSNVNSALKKSVWERHPFPNDVVMSEDQMFGRAALRAGYRIVYDPEAAVEHGHDYTLTQLFRRNFDSGHSLRGITEDGWREMLSMGFAHVRDELRHLVRTGQAGSIPYALLYECVRGLGFALGRQAHVLPRPLCARLAMHPSYWRRPS